MAWKNFVGPHAITSRRRIVASALMYGLSLTVRLTSATGEETENPAQATERTNPMISIVTKDGVPSFYTDWSSKSARPMVLHRSRPLSSRSCQAACEGPMPIPLMPSCSAP